MSARDLAPVAAALAEDVAAETPRTTRAGLLARFAVVYGRIRRRFVGLLGQGR